MASNNLESFIPDFTDVVDKTEDALKNALDPNASTATDSGSVAATDTASSTADAGATPAASAGDATANATAIIPRDAIAKTALIILAMFAVKLIYYAVITNLDILSEEFLDMDLSGVQESSLIINGINCVFLLMSGWIADSFSGYYTTMRFGAIVSLLGNVNCNS